MMAGTAFGSEDRKGLVLRRQPFKGLLGLKANIRNGALGCCGEASLQPEWKDAGRNSSAIKRWKSNKSLELSPKVHVWFVIGPQRIGWRAPPLLIRRRNSTLC